jgi:2-dehydro-3-deoxygluconokinase
MNHVNTGKIVTFGEIFLTATSIDFLRIQQSEALLFCFKGAEITVAASLSYFGIETAHVSSVSRDVLGEAAQAFIKKCGIDVSYIYRNDLPLGFHLLETGTGIRSPKIANTKFKTAFQGIKSNCIDWDKIFINCATFYWTFSTDFSQEVYDALKTGFEKAAQANISIVVDASLKSDIGVNHFLENNKENSIELLKSCTIFIGGNEEINQLLGTNFSSDNDGYISACMALSNVCSGILKFFDKVSDGEGCYARGWVAKKYIETRKIHIGEILDMHGTSEAFAAGLLYALRYYNYEHSLNFANAAFAIKHTITGDFNLSSVADIVGVLDVSR